jgi:flagellar biogenesis protein FliO
VIVLAARATVVVLALAALALLLRRRGRLAPPAAPVAVVARAPLGPGLGIAVVEAGGRRLLVGFGKDGVRLLRDLGAREEVAP